MRLTSYSCMINGPTPPAPESPAGLPTLWHHTYNPHVNSRDTKRSPGSNRNKNPDSSTLINTQERSSSENEPELDPQRHPTAAPVYAHESTPDRATGIPMARWQRGPIGTQLLAGRPVHTWGENGLRRPRRTAPRVQRSCRQGATSRRPFARTSVLEVDEQPTEVLECMHLRRISFKACDRPRDGAPRATRPPRADRRRSSKRPDSHPLGRATGPRIR